MPMPKAAASCRLAIEAVDLPDECIDLMRLSGSPFLQGSIIRLFNARWSLRHVPIIGTMF
ncbi:MAG: hypothetical protein WBF58_07495 [Xanthobacteraceae bacterium]